MPCFLYLLSDIIWEKMNQETYDKEADQPTNASAEERKCSESFCISDPNPREKKTEKKTHNTHEDYFHAPRRFRKKEPYGNQNTNRKKMMNTATSTKGCIGWHMYARIYTDKNLCVKGNTLTTKKFERILMNVVNKRPNTIIIFFFLVKDSLVLLWSSLTQGIRSLMTGSFKPLTKTRMLRIWHWCIVDGPRKFWRFPRAIQIGRSISTFIQVVFYPKHGEKEQRAKSKDADL